MKHIYLLLVCAIAFGAQAQNVQRETMQVEYISRPSQPLPDGVTTYQVVGQPSLQRHLRGRIGPMGNRHQDGPGKL